MKVNCQFQAIAISMPVEKNGIKSLVMRLMPRDVGIANLLIINGYLIMLAFAATGIGTRKKDFFSMNRVLKMIFLRALISAGI